MANQLAFVATYSLVEFKELFKVSKIDIIKNPTTSKLFFTANTVEGVQMRGAVSEGYKENTRISKVMMEDNTEMYLIHKGSAEENTVDTL